VSSSIADDGEEIYCRPRFRTTAWYLDLRIAKSVLIDISVNVGFRLIEQSCKPTSAE
jgi:hypothetical protein